MAEKLLVANRGEIACRIIRAARSLDIATVAVYSDADEAAPHVGLADEARRLGPARAQESYLNQDAVLAAAQETGAKLLHPGYGFLAENAKFARRCAREGVTFVGPKPDTIAAMGDKHRARELADKAGVPVLPGSDRLPENPAVIAAAGGSVGFPLLVKAAAGGGGIGMRQVDGPAALLEAVNATRGLAERAFGDGSVYLERFVRHARHVELQVFGFGDGRAVHLFERDCSIQRRHQKVIEEAPAPGIDDATRREMARVSVALAGACRYDGAGTIEFLYDSDGGHFYFLEMNTRIQVEHPVTEMVTGVDLVAAQIRHARGEDMSAELRQDILACRGHAIEARVYAEDPARRFLPSPGRITEMRLPQGPDLRVDAGYAAGSTVTPFYDPMLMKIVAHGPTREEAAARLERALAELVLGGIATNASFLRGVLAHPKFIAGRVSTNFLVEFQEDLLRRGRDAA